MMKHFLPVLAFTMTVPLALAPLTPARSQAPAVPDAWMTYATRATEQLDRWLNADDVDAAELRKAFQQQKGGASDSAVVLQLWVDGEGNISRVAVEGGAAGPSALADRLTGRHLADSPPRGMRLPLRIEAAIAPSTN